MAAQTTLAQWQEKAQATRFRTQAFIDGRYVDAQSGATFDNVNPANGKVFAKVAATDGDTPRRVKSFFMCKPPPLSRAGRGHLDQ